MKQIKKCRICDNKELIDIGSFGDQYLTNFPEKIDYTLPRCPLDLVWCFKCGLLQLKHTANFDYLYRKYWYFSGINQTMQNDLRDIVKEVEARVSLDKDDVVIDIGSNDGTLLRQYNNKTIKKVGFEPALNLMDKEIAEGMGITLINNFFNLEDFKKLHSKKAKAITAIAMFYDLDEPNKFVEDMENCLDDDGIIIIQLNYVVNMIEKGTFDNISHEHLEYYSLITLDNLLNSHNLETFDLEFNRVNGGSIRLYVCKKGKRKIKPIVAKIKKKERILDLEYYRIFATYSNGLKKTIYNFLLDKQKDGKSVYVYGASTRGNALLQACNIDANLVKKAADRNPMKHGHYMVGSWIPIISEEEMRKDKPDYLFVLPWQFIQEMVKREKDYLLGGGKMVVFFPKFKIYDSSNVRRV